MSRVIDYYIPQKAHLAPPAVSLHSLDHLPTTELARACISSYTREGDLVLDPFSRSSTVLCEAISQKRRCIAISFNPLDALLTSINFVRWPSSERDAALTRIGDAPKHGSALRDHLANLYRSQCAQCAREVIADYFIWDRDLHAPISVHYSCPHCGPNQSASATALDLHVANEVDFQGLHYHYVLERLAPSNEIERKQAERLLSLYTARNLYALANLAMKVEGMFLDSPSLPALQYVLLYALATGSKLNPPPAEAKTGLPLRLQPPKRFTEYNVWRLFERFGRGLILDGFSGARLADSPSALVSPDLFAHPWGDEQPNVFIGNMTVRRLTETVPPASVSLILANPPQPDLVGWPLSFLWSAWLYGRRAAANLRPISTQRLRDWTWFTRALRASFENLRQLLRPDGVLILTFSANLLAVSEAILLAAAGASLNLQGFNYHPNEPTVPRKPWSGTPGCYTLTFVPATKRSSTPPETKRLGLQVRKRALAAAREVLCQRGEPAVFNWLHNAAWYDLFQAGLLADIWQVKTLEAPSRLFLRQRVRAALERGMKHHLLQIPAEEGAETCTWWLQRPPPRWQLLSDRVEEAALEVLAAATDRSDWAVRAAIYSRFPGLLTPEPELVRACLESYGQQREDGGWQLRADDEPPSRQAQFEGVLRTLVESAEELGFHVRVSPTLEGNNPNLKDVDLSCVEGLDMVWHRERVVEFGFLIQDTAQLIRMLTSTPPVNRRFLVIPERRVGLLAYKLRRLPSFSKALMAAGWAVVRSEQLAGWAASGFPVESWDRITGTSEPNKGRAQTALL